MATLRLSFLYPSWVWMVRACEPTPARTSKAIKYHRPPHVRSFHSAIRSQQEATPRKRYGKAREPQLSAENKTPPSKPDDDVKPTSDKSSAAASKDADSAPERPSLPEPASDSPKPSEKAQAAEAPAPPQRDPPPTEHLSTPNAKPLETVLHMDPPSSSTAQAQKPPHLQAPPYVHHFDTYTLVRDLERGGFTQEQAVTHMKAVRSLLALNAEVAKEGLVSKSDVENETYLFRAACSELRTEIQNNRKGATEEMRTQRNQLQHELDILNQRTTQDLLTLKEELKGMFNDRKMAVREEQRGMESQIQELNYKITVSLNSDAKSDVEGLRWVLTRRAAMAIATMAFLILSSLRVSSYQLHSQEAAAAAASSSSSSSSASASQHNKPSSTSGSGGVAGASDATSRRHADGGNEAERDGERERRQGQEVLANLAEGETGSYVSLG
ncbi:MAG: hypothetical protein M1833_001426 [Piccolia ochrophora]|nr:MAG: hypothetical protein M1833_001426 [Piccolia ochrophora]